jgi:cell division transport system permease protein
MGPADARRRFRAWGRRHSYSFFSSLGALLKHRLGTLMTVLVLAIAILLPLGLYVTLKNLNRLDLQREDWGAITVFIRSDVTAEELDDIARVTGDRPDVIAVDLVSPEQGMAEFQEASGFGQSLEMLEENPLPWVMVVSPAVAARQTGFEEGQLAGLMAHLGDIPQVESVQYDYKWLQRLGHLLEVGRAAVTVLAVLFGLAVIVVVSNTIRLDVAARSEEIEIFALVGAGNGFIRQPFLYTGLWYGLMGGALAAGLMYLCLFYLEAPLTRLLDAYGHGISLYGLGSWQLAVLLAVSGLLGMLGAWISVRRYLRMLVVGGSLGRR